MHVLYVHFHTKVHSSLFAYYLGDESDDEFSTGAIVTITIVATFIITLVITALITYIITSMYYKHMNDNTKESVIKQDDPQDPAKSTNNHEPSCATDIPVDTNQTNGTVTSPDNNPNHLVTTL